MLIGITVAYVQSTAGLEAFQTALLDILCLESANHDLTQCTSRMIDALCFKSLARKRVEQLKTKV